MGGFDPLAFDFDAFDASILDLLPPGQMDHVALARDRLCQQWRDKPNIVALLTLFAKRWNDVETAFWELLTLTDVYSAFGSTLDQIGKLVGQPRNGLLDDTYRRYILARILTNKSDGVLEDLIAIAYQIINDATVHIVTSQEGAATLRMATLNIAITDAIAAIVFDFLSQAVSGGVRIVYQWSTALPAATFTLDIGPGLDVGILSSQLG